MRHFRMSNVQITDLTLKRHIGNYLNELNKIEENKELSQYSKTSEVRHNRKTLPHNKNNKSRVKKKFKFLSLSGTVKVKRRVLKCRACAYVGRFKKALLAHFKGEHGYSPISCKKCKRVVVNDTAFEWHLINDCHPRNADKHFECNECIRAFKTKRTLIKHLEGHRRNNCTYCEKIFTRRRQLVKHLLEEHSIKAKRSEVQCQFCEKSYVKKRTLYAHIKKHHGNDKFVCLECGEIINSISEYTEHTNYHEIQKPYMCPKCNEKFLRRQQYLDHLKRHNRYTCVTCDKTFASRAKALPHKQLHHEVIGLEPTNVCPLCQRCFYTNSRLQKHVKKHTEVKPTVSCKYCKKTFNTLLAYYKHCMTAIHGKHTPLSKQQPKKASNTEKQRRFECLHCSYTTNNKNNFTRHYELHFATNKKFPCEHCSKEFTSLACLKDHVSYNHLQDKIYKCETCPKSFKRKSELVRHQGSHSKERPHVCKVCGTSYKRSTHLKRHEKCAHKNETLSTNNKRPTFDGNCATTKLVQDIQDLIDPLTLIQDDDQNLLLLNDEDDANLYCNYNLLDNNDDDDFNDLNIVDQFVNSALPTDLSMKGDHLFGDATLINNQLLEESDREITEYIKTYMQ